MKKFTKMWAVAACALFAGTTVVNAEDYTWKFVTAGDATTYAIRSDGSLWSWGWNEKGQGGNGVSERTATPTLADGNRVWKKSRWRESIRLSFGGRWFFVGRLELMRAACRGQTMVLITKS